MIAAYRCLVFVMLGLSDTAAGATIVLFSFLGQKRAVQCRVSLRGQTKCIEADKPILTIH